MASIFFASMYTQIMAPHKILGFSVYFLFIIFFSVPNETKEGEFHLGPNRFFIHLYKILIRRAHQILCKSLAPFRIFSWVDSVQLIIKRCRRGNSIKHQKVANHLWKIPNQVFPSHMARASLRKSLRPIQHWNAYKPQKP